MEETENDEEYTSPSKKIKLENKSVKKKDVTANKHLNSSKNDAKLVNGLKKGTRNSNKGEKHKIVTNVGGKFNNNYENKKPQDWMLFKKEKKKLKLKRKQSKEGFDVITRAKKMSEEVRRKVLKGGEEKRLQLINELHNILRGKGYYPKFVVAHDTARIVQWLLKYGTNVVKQQISEELIPVTINMLQSKYGIFCVKRLLKYGSSKTRSQVIEAMCGNAVKLSSHVVSAPVVELAFSTWATPLQKQYLIQEFYGDLFKNSKDINIKHLRDTYKDNETIKTAILGATKANLLKILNKKLLDSGLIQSVLWQFLSECSEDDRKELIPQLIPYIVIISNSKDGAKVAMQCIWHGSSKDRKVIMKQLKEHVVDLSKHEHGYLTVIALLDSVDDTVLLNKIILVDLLKSAKVLAGSEWGRKVLLWLVAPADTTKFHKALIGELNQGRQFSTCKKSPEIRRKEILEYAVSSLLDIIINDAQFWLSSTSLAIVMVAVVKAANGEVLKETYDSIVKVITELEWKIKEHEKTVLGIEHAGMHMTLKRLAQHDKINLTNGNPTFGAALIEKLKDVLAVWLKLNRGCFLLITIFENESEDTRNKLRRRIRKHLKLLKEQDTQGAKILLQKLI